MSTRKKAAPRRPRGRPSKKALQDFIIADAEPEMQERIKHFQTARVLHLLPHEAAAEDMQEVCKVLGNISAKRYRNLRSECRYSRVPVSEWPAPDEHDPPDHPMGEMR